MTNTFKQRQPYFLQSLIIVGDHHHGPIVRIAQELTELCGPLAIHGDTRPVVRPSLIPPATQRNHGLNREAHARLASTNCLILRVMRNIRRAMKKLVDTVPAVCLDDTAV